MTSFRALDGVTSFLCLKDVTNTCKRLRRGLSIVKYWRELFSAKAESWKKLKTSNLFLRRLLCNEIEIEQLQCVICCFLGNFDRIISDALEKQNRNGKKHKESNFSN